MRNVLSKHNNGANQEKEDCKVVYINSINTENVKGAVGCPALDWSDFEWHKLYYFGLCTVLILPIIPVLHFLIFMKGNYRILANKIKLIPG